MTPAQERARAKAALRLAAADPILAAVIERVGGATGEAWRAERPEFGPFESLVRRILGQQVSAAAAWAVFHRLVDACGGALTPARLLDVDLDALRGLGMSRRKGGYLHDLATAATDGRVEFDRIASLDDHAIRTRLTSVKGIGPWSVDMFLVEDLRRPDVLPAGDLGIRKAVQAAWGLDALPSAEDVAARGEAWRPFRSLAAEFLFLDLYGGKRDAPARRRSA